MKNVKCFYSEWSKMRAERLLGQLNGFPMIARGLIGWRAKGKEKNGHEGRKSRQDAGATKMRDAAKGILAPPFSTAAFPERKSNGLRLGPKSKKKS